VIEPQDLAGRLAHHEDMTQPAKRTFAGAFAAPSARGRTRRSRGRAAIKNKYAHEIDALYTGGVSR
jgi:hypothetical protein